MEGITSMISMVSGLWFLSIQVIVLRKCITLASRKVGTYGQKKERNEKRIQWIIKVCTVPTSNIAFRMRTGIHSNETIFLLNQCYVSFGNPRILLLRLLFLNIGTRLLKVWYHRVHLEEKKRKRAYFSCAMVFFILLKRYTSSMLRTWLDHKWSLFRSVFLSPNLHEVKHPGVHQFNPNMKMWYEYMFGIRSQLISNFYLFFFVRLHKQIFYAWNMLPENRRTKETDTFMYTCILTEYDIINK